MFLQYDCIMSTAKDKEKLAVQTRIVRDPLVNMYLKIQG